MSRDGIFYTNIYIKRSNRVGMLTGCDPDAEKRFEKFEKAQKRERVPPLMPVSCWPANFPLSLSRVRETESSKDPGDVVVAIRCICIRIISIK